MNGRISTKKGTLDFGGSMPPDEAKSYYENFVRMVGEAHSSSLVKDGVFGAMMEVCLVNDGPTTLIVDSSDMKAGGAPPARKGEVSAPQPSG